MRLPQLALAKRSFFFFFFEQNLPTGCFNIGMVCGFTGFGSVVRQHNCLSLSNTYLVVVSLDCFFLIATRFLLIAKEIS